MQSGNLAERAEGNSDSIYTEAMMSLPVYMGSASFLSPWSEKGLQELQPKMKKLQEDYPNINIEKYKKVSEYRVFRTKDLTKKKGKQK